MDSKGERNSSGINKGYLRIPLIGDTSPIGEIVIISNERWVEGNANESRSFVDYVGRKTRGEYRCAVAMKWNDSFHASEYQIVAFTDEEDDVHDVRECNSRREVLAALRGLKQKRVAQSVADWQYSREC